MAGLNIENPAAAKETSNDNAAKTTFEEDLTLEYIDKRSVTITSALNYSNYRKVNMKVLGQRREVIGSCVRSCQILSSNANEVNKYFPALIGVSPNNEDYMNRVKGWLSNIHFVVSDKDVSLDTSFRYDHKSDYLAIRKKEDAIEEEFNKVDRSNIDALAAAVKAKTDAICALEATKWQYGMPLNVEQYLIYRHCLLYGDVAKDPALINKANFNIRFYIKDEALEQKRKEKTIQEKNIAMRNFVELSSNDKKFDAVYIAISVLNGNSVGNALMAEKTAKQDVVMNFVNDNPAKFNKIYNDKKIMMKSFIETLIARGELIRSDFNQQIATADGTFIGSNMNDAIAWFENPNNAAERTKFENKLKLA